MNRRIEESDFLKFLLINIFDEKKGPADVIFLFLVFSNKNRKPNLLCS